MRPTSQPAKPAKPAKPAMTLVVGVFYLLALPFILTNHNHGRAFFDQLHFHLPTIIGFIDQLDFSDYHAASTPGYHTLIAIVGKMGVSSEIGFKLFNSLFTAALLALMAWFLAPAFGKLKTLLLLLPVMLSIYIFPAGVWLIPDNLAWLSVAAMILMVTRLPFSQLRFLAEGLILLCAMLVRQTNLWLAAVIWATTLAYGLDQRHKTSRKTSALLLSFVVSLPAFIAFYLFYHQWGGFVPPSFQQIHQQFSWSVPAFFFSIFAFYSAFYLPVILPGLRVLPRQQIIRWFALGACIGFIIAIFPETTYSKPLGRLSGLWNLVKLTPSFGHSSLFILVLSTLGGGFFAAMLCLFKRELRLVIALSTLAFILSQLVNKFVYERYFAGFVFILLVVFLRQSIKVLGKVKVRHQTDGTKWVWAGPITFALFNCTILLRGIL